MQRSRGFRSKSRRKMTKVVREGRSNPITNRLQKFEEGDLVHITINPSIQKVNHIQDSMEKLVKSLIKKEKLTLFH